MDNLKEKYDLAYSTIQQNHTKSIKLYKELLTSDPDHCNGNHDLTMLYAFTKQYDLALKQANLFMQKFPNDFRVYNCFGYIYYKLGKYQEALSYFNQVMKYSDFWGAQLNLGLTYLHFKDYEKAEEFFHEVLKKENNYRAIFGLGLCFCFKEEYREAKKSLKRLHGNNAVMKQVNLLLQWIKYLEENCDDPEVEDKFRTYLEQLVKGL